MQGRMVTSSGIHYKRFVLFTNYTKKVKMSDVLYVQLVSITLSKTKSKMFVISVFVRKILKNIQSRETRQLICSIMIELLVR